MKRLETTKLKPTSVGLPIPLLAWIDQQAKEHGMTRNAWIVLHFSIARQTGSNANLQVRVSALEHRLKAANL